MKPHKLTLLICVAACLAYVYSCQATSNTLARWGGAATGAGLGAAVGGPLGAGVGALAGDAGGDALVQDPPTTEIHNAPGGTVYAPGSREPSWLSVWWPWLLAGALAIRFHAYIIGFFRTLLTGGFKAAGLNLAAMVVDVGAKAKTATLYHSLEREARKVRRPPNTRPYPNRPVSPLNPETFEPKEHGA